MLDWLIVGGGIHGTYLANLLTAEARVPRDAIRVLDPHPAPLAVWNRGTENCGMRYLRSPSAHNIDIRITSVLKFARTPEGAPLADFIPNYYRPSLALFRAHCDHVIRTRKLAELRIQGTARAIHRTAGGFTAETDAAPIHARRVILCLGLNDQPCRPRWADLLRKDGGPVAHVFDPDFRRGAVPADGETLVVGGGITAVQLALALAEDRPGRVALLSRHPLRENNFDFDPCWIGPKCLRGFSAIPYDRRREVVDAARNFGTVPGETLERWNVACAEGRVRLERSAVRDAIRTRGRVRLTTDDGELETDRIFLATGFDPRRPGGAMVDRMIAEMDLPTAPCGFPVLDEFFQWTDGLFLTGALAELRGGPCARNIVGARNFGRVLLSGPAAPRKK
jgi:hypothetical protein